MESRSCNAMTEVKLQPLISFVHFSLLALSTRSQQYFSHAFQPPSSPPLSRSKPSVGRLQIYICKFPILPAKPPGAGFPVTGQMTSRPSLPAVEILLTSPLDPHSYASTQVIEFWWTVNN